LVTAPSQRYVHQISIAHPPIPCKSARRKLAFLPGKSNAHFIAVRPSTCATICRSVGDKKIFALKISLLPVAAKAMIQPRAFQLSNGRIESASICMLKLKNGLKSPAFYWLPSSRLNGIMIGVLQLNIKAFPEHLSASFCHRVFPKHS